uniref:Uncharacterized protein n=1 Tax=Glossina pallidipes TaxID=7398 RepID=A0A1A9ZF19_GLOPL
MYVHLVANFGYSSGISPNLRHLHINERTCKAILIKTLAFASLNKKSDVSRPFQRLAMEQQSAQFIFILAWNLRSSRTQYRDGTITTHTFFTDNGIRKFYAFSATTITLRHLAQTQQCTT